jgi:hypothetical protein
VASEEVVAEIEQMALIDPNELEIDETAPDQLPSAMLAYKLVLRQPGQRALVTISLSDPAPPGATWIKYDAVNGWRICPTAIWLRHGWRALGAVLRGKRDWPSLSTDTHPCPTVQVKKVMGRTASLP